MRVLYIDGVGPFGGASRSLYEAVRALPAGGVDAFFIVQRGTVVPFYRELARDIVTTRGLTRFDNTRYGHYRGVRWLVVLREFSYIPFMIVAILKAKWRWKSVDLIHANEITEIIPLLLARLVFRAPAITHVRSLQRVGERTLRTRWLQRRLRRDLTAIVAIDENARSTLPADIAVDVIHNSFTPKAAPQPDLQLLQRLDALRPGSLKVGFIGNLHLSKGLFDLLEAARIVQASGSDVQFVIVGGVTRSDAGLKGWLLGKLGFSQNVQNEVIEKIDRYGLRDSFLLFGHSADIQRVYERIDVLCFPSHFDAPGRPVFEAAFSAVPSIVAVLKPRPDTLIDGETGIAVPGHDVERLAAAIRHFAENRAEVARMGRNARALAERNFDPAKNSRQLYELYERVARTRDTAAAGAARRQPNVDTK